MRDAVIVAAARTPIGRAYKGAFNATAGATLGALSLEAAVARAGIEGAEVDDVVCGAALQQGAQAGNIARDRPRRPVRFSVERTSGIENPHLHVQLSLCRRPSLSRYCRCR